MAGEESFCKLETDSDEAYYLHSQWEESGRVKLCLSDGENGWNGTLSQASLKDSCRSLKMDFQTFLAETRKALTRDNIGSLTFKYDVKQTRGNVMFVWKKYIAADKIKIQLGKVELQASDDMKSVLTPMFEHCITAQSQYRDKLSALASDNERLVTERASALKKLDKYVSAKENLEQDLYSKFVLIINEKKAKIRSLKEELADALDGKVQQSVEPSTSGTGKKSRSVTPEPADVKQEPDSEYDTDEDREALSAPPVKKSRVKQEVTDTVDELLDDMMDDGDDVKPVVRKGRVRGRKGRGGGKQTPAKPVLPKTPSGDAQSSKRRTPLRKTSSDVSNKSSQNLDELVDAI